MKYEKIVITQHKTRLRLPVCASFNRHVCTSCSRKTNQNIDYEIIRL